MLAREYDWGFGVGRGFKGLDAAFVDLFGFFDRFELVLEAHTNGADIGLNPN